MNQSHRDLRDVMSRSHSFVPISRQNSCSAAAELDAQKYGHIIYSYGQNNRQVYLLSRRRGLWISLTICRHSGTLPSRKHCAALSTWRLAINLPPEHPFASIAGTPEKSRSPFYQASD